MSIFKIFQHPPLEKEITDKEEIKKKYKYWRLRIFYSMYIGYAFFYLTRKSFTFAMAPMMSDLGFTKTDLGILGSILYITYGISKFVSGIMSDRSNPRYFMAVGLILTGIFNIFFGLSSSLILFAIFWGLNGWFQGWGWPPCARLLTHWYAQTERGTWWGVWSTSHNVGGALIPLIIAAVAAAYGWRIAMFAPGVLCITLGFFLINRLRDTPQSLGLPTIEKFKAHKEDKNHAAVFEEEEEDVGIELSKKEILMDYVLKNKFIWMLGFSYFFVYIIRTAINDWGLLYLYEAKGFTLMSAAACIFSFELGGFFGSLSSGWISDVLFKGKRGPVNVLYSLGVILAAVALWYTPFGSLIFANVAMFFTGFLIFGPQMLIGVAAAELSHKNAAGTATGFIGWFAYSGAAFAGFPFGLIAQSWGWDLFFTVICICAVFSVLLLMPLWSATKATVHRAQKKRVAGNIIDPTEEPLNL